MNRPDLVARSPQTGLAQEPAPPLTNHPAEQEKWDKYYASLAPTAESDSLRAFHQEFTGLMEDLLEPGNAVLEAGCGAASQSRALARLRKYAISLMDFSPEALKSARRLFDGEGLAVAAQLGDVFTRGEPCYDLVFNAGVLEHYTLEQQADFLRGMASRSRRFVLVLVPNRLCYWYWIWRIRAAGMGYWDFGKECPLADLSTAFAKAGLQFLGQTVLGETWTEDQIHSIGGVDESFRRDVLAIHRSPLLQREHKCYLMAALGTVEALPVKVPRVWTAPANREEFHTAELTAALADALALRLNGEARLRENQERFDAQLREAQQRYTTLAEDHARIQAENSRYREFTASKVWRIAELLQKVRLTLAPRGSWRAHTVRKLLRAARWTTSVMGRLRPPSAPPVELRQVLRRAAHSRRPIIFLPSIRWTATLFQRPQHLARELARLGHLVIYDCTGTLEPLASFQEVEPNLFLYKGDSRHLHALPDPVLWTFACNFEQLDSYPASTACVYDWIDDLAVWDSDPRRLRKNHERGLREAVLVASVSRTLHEQARTVRPDAMYLPNAAEYDRFASATVTLSADPALKRFVEEARPVAGYYGALASWFDYALLREVAARRPDWNFVLIGPDHDGSIGKQALLHCPNVAWLGPRDYETLPGYLKLFDVAMIPFVRNAITEATSPLKLYEFFSAGKPVITTPMPECLAYPEVHVAQSADDFSMALDAALAESLSEEFRQRLRALGQANSWAARARVVAEHLQDRRAGGVNPPVAA